MFRLLRFVVLTLLAISLSMILVPMASGAQEETPEAECPVTTPEENAELATMYWEEVWWGDQGKIAEIVAPDEVHHWGIGGDTTGFEEFSERWGLFFTAFPDLEFTVDLVVAEDDLVATHWTATGTQRGEWQGIAPTNRQVTWQGTNIFRFECGQIVESWSEADHLGLRQQLGATDVPAMMATPAGMATPTAARATPCPDDTPERNVAIAHRWSEDVITGKNLDVLDETLDPLVVHHFGMFPDAHGVPEVKAGLARLLEAFPDIVQTDEDTFADGDLVVVRWSASATHQGPMFGLPATGKTVQITGINIYRIDCGKIIESWSETNALDVLRELT